MKKNNNPKDNKKKTSPQNKKKSKFLSDKKRKTKKDSTSRAQQDNDGKKKGGGGRKTKKGVGGGSSGSVKDIYKFNFFKLLELEYDISEFDPFRFIANLPAIKPQVKKFCIPKKTSGGPKTTLVLDLDETLVHCATYGMKVYDMIFPVVFNGVEYKVFVKKRPYFKEFLQFAQKYFEVIVFTASHKTYANKLLDLIDKEKKLIEHRVFRDSCIVVDGNYLKDLTVLGRNLANLVIVDNSPTAFGYQIANGIPIVSWYEDEDDCELLKLMTFLKKIIGVNDVRPIVTEKFKFQEIIDAYKKKEKKRMIKTNAFLSSKSV